MKLSFIEVMPILLKRLSAYYMYRNVCMYIVFDIPCCLGNYQIVFASFTNSTYPKSYNFNFITISGLPILLFGSSSNISRLERVPQF